MRYNTDGGDGMNGINLNRPMTYEVASFRYFSKNEYHVTRTCESDVLLLVFDGILRFSEDGIPTEVHPGEYYIQRMGGRQEGWLPSDCPKYLYIHFRGEWADGETGILPRRGTFDDRALRPRMEELDRLYHGGGLYAVQVSRFTELLLLLYGQPDPHERSDSTAARMADFIEGHLLGELSLADLCEEFHFSRNYVIRLFEKEYGMTPFAYRNERRLRRAEYLLAVTSDTVESVAYASGFCHYSHFYRLFCKKNGMPPAEWRRRRRLKQ